MTGVFQNLMIVLRFDSTVQSEGTDRYCEHLLNGMNAGDEEVEQAFCSDYYLKSI